MHKRLLLLGFLRDGPLTGYEVNRLVAAHGDLFNDLKKGNVYYLLDRLAREGLVSVRSESGARGPRGERLVYSLTAAGRREIAALLRQELAAYAPVHSGIEVAMVLLDELPKAEAHALLRARLERVNATTERIRLALGESGSAPGSGGDHMLMLADAERRWLERAIGSFSEQPRSKVVRSHSPDDSA